MNNLLDEENNHRLLVFRQLEAGWDFGKGDILNEQSVESMMEYLSYSKIPTNKIGLFMTTEGNVEISYDNLNGSEVDIVFFKDGAKVFEYASDKVSFIDRIHFEELANEMMESYDK